MVKKITLEFIKRAVKKSDPTLSENDKEFKTAVMLLAAISVGANQRKIAAFTGLPLSFIRPRAKRLRKNKVWVGGRINCEWDGKAGGIAFWMDVCVAQGLLNRVEKENGEDKGKE